MIAQWVSIRFRPDMIRNVGMTVTWIGIIKEVSKRPNMPLAPRKRRCAKAYPAIEHVSNCATVTTIATFKPTAYFFPVLVGMIYAAMVWKFLLNRDLGVVNYYLHFFNVPPIPWLTSSVWAIWSVILVYVWKNVGFTMLTTLAGLQNISEELYEAARIDGAKRHTMIFRITIPLLTPIILFNMTITMINTLMVFTISLDEGTDETSKQCKRGNLN